MNKVIKFLLIGIIGIALFITLYYLTHDTGVDNFTNYSEKKSKKLNKEEANKLGEDILLSALMIYEEVPGDVGNSTKEINGKNYFILNSFMDRANELFFENEIDDFLDYYKIKKVDDNYYIEEGINEIIYIYDDVDVKVRSINKERIKYKVDWEYCEADESSDLSECENTRSYNYKNTMIIEQDNGMWKIKSFSLPEKN